MIQENNILAVKIHVSVAQIIKSALMQSTIYHRTRANDTHWVNQIIFKIQSIVHKRKRL